MAFKGDLRNISLFDVLQTLQQNQQTGVLVVQRAGVVRKIHISPAGIFFTRSYRPMRLGEIFVRRGLVTPQDVELLLLQQRDDPRAIGELMVASGKVSQEEVDEILRYHAEDEIFEIFRWDHGSFAFYDDETITDQPSKGFSEVRLDPSGLGLEMARRLDEMERLREVIPTNDEFYIQIEGYEPDRQQNGPQVLAAFDALTEPNSVDDLRDLVGLSLFDSLGVVAQLIEGGLIRPLDQDELMDASWQVRRKGDLRRAAAMLEKAHRIDPSNREVLEKCIDAVERLGNPRRLAVHLATLGNLSIGCGESEEAIELLEQAHHQDPENFAVLFALRDAFAQLGDSERCADISLKLVRAYSEDGNLAQAIEACQTGLELSPESVPLRFYLGQTLFQANRGDEAREEILTLIQETRSSAKAMKSEKAHDLLTRCYRLLLKLNPRDREAHDGLHDLARRRLNAMRRRKLAVWGSIAGSILLVVVVIGVTIAGSGAASLMERIHKAQQRNDETTVMELVGQLVERHPESDEAVQARAIRSEINKRRSDALTAKRKRETTIKSGFDAELSEIRTALRERSPLEALTLIPPFFDRLGRPEASFLRKGMRAHVDAEFTAFVDKMKEDFNVDRRHVSLHEQALRPEADPGLDELRDIEKSLAGMRAKSWTKLHDELAMPLATIAESAHAGKMREVIESLIATLESATGTFSTIDDLYYTARRMRLHAEIKQAVSLARQRGREHLRLCEFAAARKYFDDAHKLADAVADEEPREHFLELLNWLEKTNTRSDMARRRDEVDLVVKRLEQIEKLIAADRPAAAFRLFRPLISEHRLIQFERKYELPFRVNSTPRGAEVFVNEKRVGVTPATIKLGILGSTEVRVRRKGFTEAEAKLLPFDPALDGETNLVLVKKSAWEREVNGRVEARPVVAGKLLLIATSNANLLAHHGGTRGGRRPRLHHHGGRDAPPLASRGRKAGWARPSASRAGPARRGLRGRHPLSRHGEPQVGRRPVEPHPLLQAAGPRPGHPPAPLPGPALPRNGGGGDPGPRRGHRQGAHAPKDSERFLLLRGNRSPRRPGRGGGGRWRALRLPDRDGGACLEVPHVGPHHRCARERGRAALPARPRRLHPRPGCQRQAAAPIRAGRCRRGLPHGLGQLPLRHRRQAHHGLRHHRGAALVGLRLLTGGWRPRAGRRG
jgi:tetratricopeptide (TPR) repeat protein